MKYDWLKKASSAGVDFLVQHEGKQGFRASRGLDIVNSTSSWSKTRNIQKYEINFFENSFLEKMQWTYKL